MIETTRILAQYIVDLKYGDIPAEALEIVKLDLLDFFGNALGGSSDDAVGRVLEFARSIGGEGQCNVIAGDSKLPASAAAMVNGMMGFALDFDDTHEGANTHLGVACFPAAFAAAGLVGGVNGKEFLTAVTGALEMAARIGIACNRKIPRHVMGGWDYTALHGCLSATAAAGKLLGLSTDEMLSAFGLAYQQLSGNTLAAIEEADSKKLGPGFAARDGVTAALLAKAGVTGARSIISETQFSLFNMYHDGGDENELVKGLGIRYTITDMGFKPYPCCRLGHRHIDAVLNLIRENNISAGSIEKIYVTVSPPVAVQLCEPRGSKIKPKTRSSAQFSLPWVLACACARGKVGVAEFLQDALSDDKLVDFAARVETRLDESLKNEMASAVVRLETPGKNYETMTCEPYGSPENPMSFTDLERKFRDNMAFCTKKLSAETIDSGLEMIRNIDSLADAGIIIQHFS